MFLRFPGLLEPVFDSGFDLRLESYLGLLVSNVIPPDDNKRGFENEHAFIEFSVIIHVVLMANYLNKSSRLVVMNESRKWDSVKRKVILSLNVDIDIYQMENYMKRFDYWRAWSRGQIYKLQQWNKRNVQSCVFQVSLSGTSRFQFLFFCTMQRITF